MCLFAGRSGGELAGVRAGAPKCGVKWPPQMRRSSSRGRMNSPWDQEDSAALGHGTNNLGELWAIGMAMQIAARRVRNHPQDYHQFKIFSDSQYSIGILTQGWKSRTHPKLACKLRHLYNNFPIPISIEWVPAHVGIDSNERADELADRGAKKSAKKGADINASTDFERGDFQPVRNG
jgi:ribonuclease HI